jgi:AcrR family transcriptional regulator
MPATAPRRPGRPHDEALTPSILRAAIEELAAAGFEALSLEQVARRAGTAKTSLYRRWPSKDDLIVDALRMFVGETGLVDAARVDRGSLREDLLGHARHLVAQLTQQRIAVMSGLLLALRTRPALAELVRETLVGAEGRAMQAIAARAVDRGELDPSRISRLSSHVLASMLFMRLFIAGAPLTDAQVVEIVDDVVLKVFPARTSRRR